MYAPKLRASAQKNVLRRAGEHARTRGKATVRRGPADRAGFQYGGIMTPNERQLAARTPAAWRAYVHLRRNRLLAALRPIERRAFAFARTAAHRRAAVG
jgi:hypothetical protein